MTWNCPHCGAEIPQSAAACPECGSDKSTGWSEKAYADNLGLPDDDFNYEEFVKDEFGVAPRPRHIGWFWWGVAVMVLLFFLFWALH